MAIDPAGRPVLAGTFRGSIDAGGSALVNSVQSTHAELVATFAADGAPVASVDPAGTTVSVYASGAAIDAVMYFAG